VEGYEQEKAAQMIKEEHERMKAVWHRNGLSDDLHRRFTMYLLNLRSQGMDSTSQPPPRISFFFSPFRFF
jgi:hypothetical protein